jgi:hypothetical protein
VQSQAKLRADQLPPRTAKTTERSWQEVKWAQNLLILYC